MTAMTAVTTMTINKGGRPKKYYTLEDKLKSRSGSSLKCYYNKIGLTPEEAEAKRLIREQNRIKRENKKVKSETRIKLMKRIKKAMNDIQEMETEQLKIIMVKLNEIGLSSSSDENSD